VDIVKNELMLCMSYLSDFHTKSALEASSSCSFSTFFLCGAVDIVKNELMCCMYEFGSYLSDFHTKSTLEASSSCSFSTFFSL
jgi:hypothetical protein